MRLWSIHPQYLDTQGLLAVWREGLLAQKVLLGQTKGYKNHPQLIRFKNMKDPVASIGNYLKEIVVEAKKRNFLFQEQKIMKSVVLEKLPVTNGQIQYEWQHFLRKAAERSPACFERYKNIRTPDAHPIFQVILGEIENWEIKIQSARLNKRKI